MPKKASRLHSLMALAHELLDGVSVERVVIDIQADAIEVWGVEREALARLLVAARRMAHTHRIAIAVHC